MGNTIKLPVGGNVEIDETDEQKAAKEAAEREANGGKTLAEIEAENAEAARIAAEEAAKNAKTIVLEIDGKDSTFNLNENGDVLNEDGTVLYTAAQLAEFSTGDDNNDNVPNQLESIVALSGVKILNPDGTEKKYEDTVEGFAQREVDVKKLGYEEGTNKALTLFFESNPEFKSMYDYKRVNGSLENYNNFVDYSKVELTADNEAACMQMIIDAEVAKGTSKERAERIANFSKADNTLLIDAKESQEFLVGSQKKAIEAADAAEAAAIQEEIAKEEQYYGISYDDKGAEKILNVEGSIYDMVVTKGTIGNITIPKEGLLVKQANGTAKQFSRREIFDYIHKPIVEIGGAYYSQAQVDEYQRTTKADELVATYIRNLVGGDMKELIRTAKLKDKADEVRKIVIKTTSSSVNPRDKSGGQRIILPVN